MRVVRIGAAVCVAVAVMAPATAEAKPVWAQTGAGFRPCGHEWSDGPCYWDARTMGNGAGRSFWVDARQHVHYR